MKKIDFLRHWRRDVPASIVVFLLGLPLSLGVAMASGVPIFSGLITAVVGGVLVGSLSKSSLNISGPAASMAVIVLSMIKTLPSFEAFLLALVLAGAIQVLFGVFKAGIIGEYLPSSVVTGMLSAIGISIIINQLPHAVGFDRDFVGDVASVHVNQTILLKMYQVVSKGMTLEAIFISVGSLIILIIWSNKKIAKSGRLRYLPPPLLAILFGIIMHFLFTWLLPPFAFSGEHLVRVPISNSLSDFTKNFHLPDFKYLTHKGVWAAAFAMAIIASIQALLGIESTDKLDPQRRITPPNRELMAQGIGNVVSGLLGGILLTSVIVRSLANVNAGARTSASVIFQGLLMFICILAIPILLNQIPLAALSAVLIFVGYQLVKPRIFIKNYKKGWACFIPFMITIVGILWTDLLIGVCAGLLIAAFFVLSESFRPFLAAAQAENRFYFRFERNLNFLHKHELKQTLKNIPDEAQVTFDFSKITAVDEEIIALFNDFIQTASSRSIQIFIQQNENEFSPNLILPSYEFV